jgi:hypothetical protein
MPCRFRRTYRLLHTLSDTYLAAASSSSGDYVVHVNGNYADPSTIWIVHPFGQQVLKCHAPRLLVTGCIVIDEAYEIQVEGNKDACVSWMRRALI